LLADAAARAHNREEERTALLAALNLRPRSSTTLFRLANLYLQEQKFDRAALYYGKIANINPNSADVYYQLAMAEEGRYRFTAADKAYTRAIEISPENPSYRERYRSFKARLEQNQKNSSQ
jgi:tetratricopeptide (TPR) repeat protein